MLKQGQKLILPSATNRPMPRQWPERLYNPLLLQNICWGDGDGYRPCDQAFERHWYSGCGAVLNRKEKKLGCCYHWSLIYILARKNSGKDWDVPFAGGRNEYLFIKLKFYRIAIYFVYIWGLINTASEKREPVENLSSSPKWKWWWWERGGGGEGVKPERCFW